MPSRWPRRFCCDEDLAFLGYDGLGAERDLAKWRSRGPHPATQELIEVILAEGVAGAALLDIGAGVGAVHLTLLEAGAASAVDVDASREYLATARAEAERRGLADRVEYRYGDVVELAADLPRADVVTLDSVICCYPYLPALLAAALRPGPRLVGLTFPRDVWWMRAYMRLYNLAHAVRRTGSRYFIYRHAAVNRLMAEASFAKIHEGGTRGWRVVLYRRIQTPQSAGTMRP
jgi:2-polyprenyl-3-methyl-5-hydroxy-6-metoxy-1,4-benzoquinol methylase